MKIEGQRTILNVIFNSKAGKFVSIYFSNHDGFLQTGKNGSSCI